MTKRDAILLMVIIIVFIGLILTLTNEKLFKVQQIGEELKTTVASNAEVISTLERIETLSRYERVANLRKIEKIIMLGGYGELKRTDTQKP